MCYDDQMDELEQLLVKLLSGNIFPQEIKPETAKELAKLIDSNRCELINLPQYVAGKEISFLNAVAAEFSSESTRKTEANDITGARFHENPGITFIKTLRSAKNKSRITEEQVKDWLSKALEPFHLSEEQLKKTASSLAKMEMLYLADEGSSLYEFYKKHRALLAYIKERNISLDAKQWLDTCLKKPSLFILDPQTIDANLFGDGGYEVGWQLRKGVVTLLRELDLTITNQQWLDACLKEPSLFYQDPQTINANLFGDGSHEVGGQPRKGVVTLLRERSLKVTEQQWLDA